MTLELTLPSSQILKIILAIVVIIVAVLIFYKLIRKIVIYLRRPELYGLERRAIKKRWQEIEGLLKKNDEASWRMAIMEADKLLDYVLKSMAMPGKDLGERLKMISYKYPKIRQVWWAHKIRNRLVHEAEFRIDYGTVKAALKTFRNGLKVLGIL